MNLPSSIPEQYRKEAVEQWKSVGFKYFGGMLMTYLGAGLLVALTAKNQARHPFNEPVKQAHSAKYIAEGSSGEWDYANSNVKCLQDWNNLEDGLNGEPSGKHSARCGGKERSWWNRLMWTFRNPYNWAKRTNPLYFCPVNDCAIEWWGDRVITDKAPVAEGWHFVRAVHRETGRVYYGYRSVRLNRSDKDVHWLLRAFSKASLAGTVRQVTLGFKIKPSHATEVQDADDLDKAVTFRIQFASQAD